MRPIFNFWLQDATAENCTSHLRKRRNFGSFAVGFVVRYESIGCFWPLCFHFQYTTWSSWTTIKKWIFAICQVDAFISILHALLIRSQTLHLDLCAVFMSSADKLVRLEFGGQIRADISFILPSPCMAVTVTFKVTVTQRNQRSTDVFRTSGDGRDHNFHVHQTTVAICGVLFFPDY